MKTILFQFGITIIFSVVFVAANPLLGQQLYKSGWNHYIEQDGLLVKISKREFKNYLQLNEEAYQIYLRSQKYYHTGNVLHFTALPVFAFGSFLLVLSATSDGFRSPELIYPALGLAAGGITLTVTGYLLRKKSGQLLNESLSLYNGSELTYKRPESIGFKFVVQPGQIGLLGHF